jgi:hypothetical protein
LVAIDAKRNWLCIETAKTSVVGLFHKSGVSACGIGTTAKLNGLMLFSAQMDSSIGPACTRRKRWIADHGVVNADASHW